MKTVMRLHRLCRISTLALGMALLLPPLALSQSQAAQTLEELLESDALRARIVLDGEPPLYQRAPFVLAVEVATRRWFSRGTRVRDFRIPGAVLRPVSNFASNQTRREDGSSWSVQRWRFRVYPQQPGRLELPALEVSVSVNAENNVPVEGVLSLRHPAVSIVTPPGTEDLEHWVAGSDLRVEERWSGKQDSYRPGDAVTRSRRFVLEDAPAMMLEGSPHTGIEGLALYRAPPQVTDQSNRGRLSGTREETLVITFERAGDFELPGLALPWFDIDSGELRRVQLPPTRFSVRGIAADATEAASRERTLPPPGPVALTLMLGVLLLMLFGPRLWNSPPLAGLRRRIRLVLRRARRRWRFRRALQQRDSLRCLRLLEESLADQGRFTRLQDAISQTQPEPEAGLLSYSLRQLLAHAYGEGESLPDTGAALRLWRGIARPPKRARAGGSLSLNPLAKPDARQ